MDDRRRELERIQAEIEQSRREGNSIDPTEWFERYPEYRDDIRSMLELPTELTMIPQPERNPPPTVRGSSDETIGNTPTSAGTIAFDPDRTSEPTRVAFDAGAETRFDGTTPPPSPGGMSNWPTMPGGVDETVDLDSTQPDVTLDGDSDAGAASRLEPTRPSGAPPAPGVKVRYFGDYELISILGRGGMGVVYKARQISLNRHVALKMIANAEFAGEDQLRRFQNEAEAVALLDHPAIVPIHEVGRYEDQRYFSMKLIDGQGMEKEIHRLRSDFRETARIVAEVADAIHHAHMRGILHRDLKPANILIDRGGHPHVTDFGLAKKIEGDDGLTQTGAVMGTPAYMSPEQAAGATASITTASDVYGIGAILFAALTDRAPFVGTSLMVTLDQVRNTPPDHPSKLNPGVPRDLEVICLKCLEKEPRHRYGSAGEVAADLRRWLNGEPIAARPVGPATRLAMWAKRRPALAGVSAALIVASVLGIVGIVWQWRNAVYERDRADTARQAAERSEGVARAAEKSATQARDAAVESEKKAVAARADAERNAMIAGMQATLALGTLQDLITRVDTGLNGPGLFELKTDMIRSALQRIDAVAKIYTGNTSKEATTLAAMIELGRIYRQTGQIEKANAIFERCLAIAKERMIIRNRNDGARKNLATVHTELSLCVELLNRDMNAVIAHLREAQALQEDILAKPTKDDPSTTAENVKALLAGTYMNLGASYHKLGEIDKAIEEFRHAYNLRVELHAATKDNPNTMIPLSLACLALADCSDRLDNRKAADEYFSRALELAELAAKAAPTLTAAKTQLANYYHTIGRYYLRRRELPAARTNLDKARELFAKLSSDDPRNASHARELFAVIIGLAQVSDLEKKTELARKDYDEAVRVAEANLKLDVKNDLRKIELMYLLPHVGQVDRALEIADVMAAGPKVDAELAVFLAQAYAQCAARLPEDRARALNEKAVNWVRKAIAAGFRDRAVLDFHPDLDPLRAREDFQAALKSLPKK